MLMGNLVPIAAYTGIQSALNKYSNMQTIGMQAEAQSKLQGEQNAFQAAENEKDRIFQEATWLEHFLKENEEYANRLDLQQKQWQSQFDIANAYNNPSAQMSRLLAAGINPSAMMNNSGLASLGQSSASPSASSATAPNGATFAGHSVAPAAAPSFGGLSSQAANFSSIAQMADSIGKLKQVGLNADKQAATLPVEVEKAQNEADLARQKALLTEIEKSVAAVWSDKKAAVECNKLVADSYAAFTQGDLNKANELLSVAQEKLTSVNAEINEQQAPQLMANLKALGDVYKSEKDKNEAQSVAAYASAEHSLSSAEYNRVISETERQLREGRVTALVLENAISRTYNQLLKRENIRDIKTNEWQIWKILNECKREGYATAEQLERWQIASKDNNSYELRMILQEINVGIEAAAKVAAPVAGASALPAKPPVNIQKRSTNYIMNGFR